jgi:hypothetical protein
LSYQLGEKYYNYEKIQGVWVMSTTDYKMEAGLLFYQGCILVPDVNKLREELLKIFHDSPMAGHPGQQWTLGLLSQAYYWPGIRADVYLHVDRCETCQQIHLPKSKLIPA